MTRFPRVGVAITLVVMLTACTARRQPGDVSVADLFDHPDKFEAKEVAVIGWYSSGMEESALYSDPKALIPEGIWVSPGWRRVSRLAGRYVRVVGVFHYRPEERRIEKRPDGSDFESFALNGFGHMGLYRAELSDVCSFRPLR
jgi:hypothetical protein